MKMLKQILFAVSFIGVTFVASPSFAGPDCSCRHKGGDTPEGQTACIRTNQGMKLARCERVLNNTSWKMLEQSCPTS